MSASGWEGEKVARSGGLIRVILGTTNTSKLGSIMLIHSLRPCMGQGASLGEESVLADAGRVGEITARVGRVRSQVFLSILQECSPLVTQVRSIKILAYQYSFSAAW